MCTPRAWTNAMRDLAWFSHTGSLEGFTIFDIPTDTIASVLNQYVPASAVDAFIAFLSVIRGIGDFDRAVNDVWKNGGKNFKVSAKDLSKIALPLAQLVITSHADKLPTSEEFKNLATWMADQNSDQLTSYILDIFKNVFMADVGGDVINRDKLFIVNRIKNFLKTLPQEEAKNARELYDNVWKGFYNRWGLDFDSLPSWDEGMEIVGKKYASTFKAAKIDGISALG
jgi:hypothetical protein